MTFSMRRFQAILYKEWKDGIKNPQVLMMAAMPIMFAFLFSKLDKNSVVAVTYSLLMALSMTGAFVQAMLVAEEKEKHTLRVLMISPANATEILLGKSMMTVLITIFAIVASLFVADAQLNHLGMLAMLSALLLVMFISFGIVIGLISRTVQESSIVGLPLLLIFVLGPMFGPALNIELITNVVYYLPSYHYMEMIVLLEKGVSLADQLNSLWIMLIWMVLSLVLVAVMYRKRRFDK